MSMLKESRTDLVSLAKSLTAAELLLETENPGWNVKDTLSHTVASEAGLIALGMRIVNNDTSPRPAMDLHARNQQQVDERRHKAIDELLAEVKASRQDLLFTLASLSDDELAREGQFAGKPSTAADIFGLIGRHELDHSGQIRRAVRRG
jgi:uncharacterized protein (TIGR03083 family)